MSVFEVGGVEISGEVSTPVISDLVVSAFDFIRESFISKFVHPAGDMLPRFADIMSDNGGRKVEFLVQALEDTLISGHIHPPRRFSHSSEILAMSHDGVDPRYRNHLTTSCISLNDDNTYRVRVTYHVITTVGKVRGFVKSLRAGVGAPNPVVESERPCEQTHATDLKSVKRPTMNRQQRTSTRGTRSRGATTTCDSEATDE